MKKRPNSPTPLPRFYRSDSQHAGHSPFFSAWFTPPIEFLKETLSQKGKGLLKAEGLGKKLNAIVAEEGAIRFMKQSYNLEDIRLLDWQRLKNMVGILLVALYFPSVRLWSGDEA